MKKILTYVSNKEHLEKIALFCEQERLIHVTADSYTVGSGDLPAIIISDTKSLSLCPELQSVPLCIISDDKPESGIYYLKNGFHVYHLRMLIDKIYHGSLLSNYAPSVQPISISKEYILDNDYNNIDRAVCAMTVELAFFFSFSDLEKVRVGISEMITNAIEHGNLGITDVEKMETTENGTYYDLLTERINNPKYSCRKTKVTLTCADGVLTIKIEDGGDGFDTSKIPDPTDIERLLKLHGRGIFITRMYFNEIKYNDKGNEVTLIKNFS